MRLTQILNYLCKVLQLISGLLVFEGGQMVCFDKRINASIP